LRACLTGVRSSPRSSPPPRAEKAAAANVVRLAGNELAPRR
jgi:hypothetical protein